MPPGTAQKMEEKTPSHSGYGFICFSLYSFLLWLFILGALLLAAHKLKF